MVLDWDWDHIAIPIRHPNTAGCMPYTWVSSKLGPEPVQNGYDLHLDDLSDFFLLLDLDLIAADR
ncbi:hypothetical protein PGT21_036036 [Puccinia graminis f. sp. tritici]|uniref:Uncharacterized protein n=1 Tax=Puccinia graminis f. sp. tritici TaxID=56615 RepID=A0A5B0QQH5_PUCGR|nr:hypothetical protein PGT21_036036 [Puccinia graminis f. sp. tritici]